VLGELDREALVRGTMQAGKEALDYEPRLQVDALQLGDDFGFEKTGSIRHGLSVYPRKALAANAARTDACSTGEAAGKAASMENPLGASQPVAVSD